MRTVVTLVFLFIFYNNLGAQSKQITHVNQVWYGIYPQVRFSKHWGLWNDLELHQKDHFVNGISQTTFRIGATYYINNSAKITAGYTYINLRPAEKHLYVSQPENSGWQQLQWDNLYGKKKLVQRIRLEERFKRNIVDDYTLANSSTFTWRARYNLSYQLPLSSKGITAHQPSAIVGDEVFINFGKHIINNYFDQNRVSFGIGYMVNSHDNLVAGYTYIFQQLPAENQYRQLNLLRLSFFKNVNLYNNHVEAVMPK